MLHELLFVLMGYSGDVFIPYPPDKPTTFSIPQDFPLLHPTERECLNRFGQLGWIYSQINEFNNNVKQVKDENIPHGSYVLALISSIENTLNEYRETILNMENRILNKQDEAGSNIVPLSLLTANLVKWETLLPSIWKLIMKLKEESKEYHGCKLFNLLMDQTRTGILEYRNEIEKMMIELNNVLYRQLTSWMVYGQLSDPDNEFFIIPFTTTNDISSTGWNRLYIISHDMIPQHLSITIIESILFVGKSIATVKEMNKRKELYNQKINIPMEMTRKHLKLLLQVYNNSNNTISPWIKYPQELKNIVNQVRRSTADWLFSQVLIGEHGLHKYLNSFRHLFLLNYGDLATNFIHQCHLWRKRSISRSSTIKRNPTRTAMLFRHQELNALFIKSAIGTDAEDELNGYTLILDEEKTREYPFSDLLLLDIKIILTFDLKWPIDLFLSESDLKKYSNLWSFLTSVKNTQLMLNNLWKVLRSNNTVQQESIEEEEEEIKDNHGELLVWRLLSIMLFWIDTIWNHIQTNVIDSHYQQLIDTTTPSKLDFEEIQEAHERFLKNIIDGCLLSSNDCIEIIHDILLLCLNFSDLMEKISEEGEWRKNKRRKIITTKTAQEIVDQWTKSTTDYTWIEQVITIEETFIAKTEQFFNLASLQHPEIKSSGRLDVLLMQLDYNKWFSSQQAKAKLYPHVTTTATSSF